MILRFDSQAARVNREWGFGVTHVTGKRIVGIGAAWIAAYALVLNVILSSILLATLSPVAFAAGHAICVNSADAGAVRDDAGKNNEAPSIRCPVCVGIHAAGALPPPPGPIFFDRTALPISQAFAFDAALVERKKTSDHQARGPPLLI